MSAYVVVAAWVILFLPRRGPHRQVHRRTGGTPMSRARSRLVVEIDLDPVPGWGNDPEDHRKFVENRLRATVAHYNPTVTLAARGDAATDDDALRERIEAWLATQVDSLGGGFHLVRVRDLLAVLDAAPAPTEAEGVGQ